MTYEEVRNNFVQNLAENAYLNMCTTDEMKLAISALEKQIPKKPINNGIGGYICPHCGGVILNLSHELYHRDCGGRLE